MKGEDIGGSAAGATAALTSGEGYAESQRLSSELQGVAAGTSPISERYRNTVPPSTMMVWPVTKRLASDAR